MTISQEVRALMTTSQIQVMDNSNIYNGANWSVYTRDAYSISFLIMISTQLPTSTFALLLDRLQNSFDHYILTGLTLKNITYRVVIKISGRCVCGGCNGACEKGYSDAVVH